MRERRRGVGGLGMRLGWGWSEGGCCGWKSVFLRSRVMRAVFLFGPRLIPVLGDWAKVFVYVFFL